MKNLLAPLAMPLLSKVHEFKDIHKGESCYLIGDGVSIKWFDLAAFNNKLAIPCGFIPFHNDFHKLTTEFFIVSEPWWFYPLERNPATVGPYKKNPRQRAYRDIIKKYNEKKFFINLSNYPTLQGNNIIYFFANFHDRRLPDNFITNRINAFHGSLRTSITFAIYMGFDHVYLVGCDYTHNPSRTMHWYERGHGKLDVHNNYNEEFFELAKNFIDITTITLDGKSDFINSVTYEEHTGRKLSFRENLDLTSENYLNTLSTWADYKIF